jgi:predicted nucleic acid-binding protein
VLFVESSSMVKLYVQEPDSEYVRGLTTAAARIAATWAAYVEVRAALARAHRAGRLATLDYAIATGEFEQDWQLYARMEVSRSIIVGAGDLAEQHSLRGYDAIHLASAIRLQAVSQEPVQVLTHDRELRDAVRAAGLDLLPLDPGN